jgi:hypothetical protein
MRLGTSADSVAFLCHLPLRLDFVIYGSVIENALVIAPIRISIIVMGIAFVDDIDIKDISDI